MSFRAVLKIVATGVVVMSVSRAWAQDANDSNASTTDPASSKVSAQRPEPPQGHLEVPGDPYVPVSPEERRTSPSATPRSRNGYVSVQVNVDVSGDNIVGDAANEPSIAVDPTNHNRMVIGWRQFDTITSDFRQAGWGYTADGGTTWTFPGVIEPGIFRSDPVLAADTLGNFYYNSLTAEGWDFWCHVYKSTDGGATWDSGTYAYGGDKQWMVIDHTDGVGQNNFYANWTQYWSICYPNHFTRSYDGGQSFEPCTQVSGNPYWGTLSVGPDGELYVAGDGFIVAKSTNVQNAGSTPTWTSTSVSLGGSMVMSTGPNPGGLLGQAWVETDHSGGPTHGNVYLLCSVDPSGADPLDVRFSRSTNGGSTWSGSVRVNDDPGGTNAWQWFGTMSVAPNGRIDVIWNDTRNDPGGYDSELYYAYSEDAGVTWSANEALSPAWDPHLGWPQQNKIGDYYHMVSDDTGADLAYAATFNGEQDVYYLRINVEPVCEVGLGNMNGDGGVDGNDIQAFVTCQIDGEPTTPECVCADMNENTVWDADDVEMFVDCLLGNCP